MLDNANNETQTIFKFIAKNEYKKLGQYLEKSGNGVNVVDIEESRQYTALTFAAFKNHTKCFRILYEHGCRFNLTLDKNKKPMAKLLQIWADRLTDE